MRNITVIAVFGLFTSSSLAAIQTGSSAASFNCADLRRATLKLSVHTANLANRLNTRTSEGGPYLRREVNCRVAGGSFCNVDTVTETKTQHEPGHPDADQNGNVQYPLINVGSEWAAINTAAAELKLLSSNGVCGTKTLSQSGALIIKYHSDFNDVISDTIGFRSDGQVASWSRTAKDGKSQSFSFKDDGTPIGL